MKDRLHCDGGIYGLSLRNLLQTHVQIADFVLISANKKVVVS